MNTLRHFYPGDAAALVAGNVFVQIAGVVVLSLLAGHFVARRHAAMRHALWLATLAWVCAAPAVAILTPSPRTAARRQVPPVSATSKNTTSIAMVEIATTDPAPISQPGAQPIIVPARAVAHVAIARPRNFRPFLEAAGGAGALIWAIGSVFLAIRLLRGLWLVARLRRHLLPADEVVRRVGPRVCRTLDIASLPRVALCERVTGPAAIGVLWPTVVLPFDLAAGMTDDELHDALAHECGHVLRRDYAIGIVQRIVSAVFWPHPLIHVLNQNLARAREEVCDNLVLRGNSAPAFARTLLSLAQRLPTASGKMPAVCILDGRWRLEDRVAGLLNPKRIVMIKAKRSTRIVVATSIVVVGVALSLAISRSTAGQVSPAGPAVQDVRPGPTPSATSPKPAVAETVPRETAQPADSTASFADGTPLPLKTFDQHKAELDLKESELKLKAADTDFKRIEALRGQGYSVPNSDIEHAELAANLARLQFERAQLQFEQAMNTSSTAQVRLVIEGTNNVTWSAMNALGAAQGIPWGISIRLLLTRSGVSLETPWRMTVLSRASGKVIDAELLPDLASRGRQAADVESSLDMQVHWGDVIRLNYDANKMLPVYLSLPPSRQNNSVFENAPSGLSVNAGTTLRQLLGQSAAKLKQSDIDLDNLEDDYIVIVTRVGGVSRSSFTASLKQFLAGELPGPVLQPDDHIIVRDARPRNPRPTTRPTAPKP